METRLVEEILKGPAFKPWKASGANLADTEPQQTGVSQNQMEEMIASNNTTFIELLRFHGL